MLKIPALALLAVLVVASPASAHRHHYAVAHRGHNSAVVVDPNGLNAFGLVPPGYPPSALLYDPVGNRSLQSSIKRRRQRGLQRGQSHTLIKHPLFGLTINGAPKSAARTRECPGFRQGTLSSRRYSGQEPPGASFCSPYRASPFGPMPGDCGGPYCAGANRLPRET
jgi:hypothetical protein